MPVALVAWRLGTGAGGIAGTVAALIWLVSALAAGTNGASALAVAWNTLVRLSVFLIVVVLLARLRAARAQAHDLARIDSLTGVANSSTFTERIELELERMRRNGRPLTLAYVDLDDFTEVNAHCGHRAGDELLRAVGQVLRTRTRRSDVVGRLGGDEFAILLTDTGEAESEGAIRSLSERIGDAIRRAGYPSVTLSVGAVTFLVAPETADEMIGQADVLMDSVKQGGKNGIAHRRVIDSAPQPDLAIAD